MLTHIQTSVFPFDSIPCDYRTPFKKLRSTRDLVDKINYLAPVLSNIDVDTSDSKQIYQFLLEFMNCLFTP